MTTISGRIGGQYNLTLVAADKYRVYTRMPGNHAVTLFTGDYETATKLMDFCVLHDADAQDAAQQLFFDGDPTKVSALIDAAKISTEARQRRKVMTTVEIETDVLEGENSIQIVMDRLNAACVIAGVRVNLIQAQYTDTTDRNRMTDLGRIARQRDFLLDHQIATQDGIFVFPDGTAFPCRKLGDPKVNLELVQSELAERTPLTQDANPTGGSNNAAE